MEQKYYKQVEDKCSCQVDLHEIQQGSIIRPRLKENSSKLTFFDILESVQVTAVDQKNKRTFLVK